MTSPIQSYKIVCSGGLNTSQNYLGLSENPGVATKLVNFESAATGGYRRIQGYAALSSTYPIVTSTADPAEGPVLGVFGFAGSSTSTLEFYAARKKVGVNEYKIYKLTSTGWVAQATGITHSSVGVNLVRTEIFSMGGKNIIVIVDGTNNAVVFDGTKWYSLKSSNTGTEASPGGDQLLDAPSIVTNFKNHIFLSGDVNYPDIVCHSAPNGFLDWKAASGAGQLIANLPVVNIKPFRDELFIFGRHAIKRCVVKGVDFTLEDVTNNLGCISRDSVFELAGNILFLSADGVRIVAGTAKIGDIDLSAVSHAISNTFLDLQKGNVSLDNLRTTVIRKKTQFRYFISSPNIARDDSYGVIGCLKSGGEETTWEWGELRGIRASCAWSGYDNTSSEIVLHGDYDGSVFKQETGNSFNGNPIFAQYTTPYIDFGDTEIRKIMRKLNTFIKAEGSFSIAVAVTFDWDNIYSLNPADYTEGSSNNPAFFNRQYKYDSGNVYVGGSQPIFHTNIQGSGFSTQLSFVSEGVYAPFIIQGFVLEFTAKGRQ